MAIETSLGVGRIGPVSSFAAGGKEFLGGLEIEDAEAYLPRVVEALGATGRLARGLHRWQQQGDENANDGDDDE